MSLHFLTVTRINSDYVNKTLAKGWINRYGGKLPTGIIEFLVLKKLHKESKQVNQFDLPPIRVTDFYAGKSIYGFWKRYKEEKRVYELQKQEKLGLEYDGFQLQQRLANLEFKRANPHKPLRRVMRKRTSLDNLSSGKGVGSEKTVQEKSESESSSLDYVQERLGSPETQRRVILRSETHLEQLRKYKRNTIIHNLAQTNSQFPRVFDENDFWLQQAPNKSKCPVAINLEVDKFLLDCLDQQQSKYIGSLKESELNTEHHHTRSGFINSNNDLSSSLSKIASRKHLDSSDSRPMIDFKQDKIDIITEEEKLLETRENERDLNKTNVSTESKIRRTNRENRKRSQIVIKQIDLENPEESL